MSDENFSPNDLGITEADWHQTPLSVRALVNRLHQRMEKIEEQLKLNSDTSSKPPSSDAPRHKREKKGKLPSGKKRGAQRGHKGTNRKPKPPDEVSEFHVHRPETCQHCGDALAGEDAAPYRWQVTEIPPIKPIVIEHQIHTLTCACGKATRGQMPPEVANSQFGPRLTAMVGMLIGQERLSKWGVKRVLKTLFDVDISVGAVVARQQEVSGSLAEPYEAVAAHVKTAASRNIDETPWRESGQLAWLWALVSAEATLFHVSSNRKRATAEALLGDNPDAGASAACFPPLPVARWPVRSSRRDAGHLRRLPAAPLAGVEAGSSEPRRFSKRSATAPGSHPTLAGNRGASGSGTNRRHLPPTATPVYCSATSTKRLPCSEAVP